jgi:GntR family transcriptional regulator
VPDRVRPAAYRTLADTIRSEIRGGQYAGGRRLPTEEELSASYSVSRQTVRRAMQDLVSEGIIYRVAGRGTYPVAEEDRYIRQFGSVEDLMALSLDTECEIVRPLRRRVDVANAGRLRLGSDELYALALIRRHGGVPFCHTSVFLPPAVGELVAGLPELTQVGRRSRVTVIGLLDARLSRAIMSAEQSITATAAPAFAAGHLACDPGGPALRVDRLYSDEAGHPVELAVSYFDPEHYSYRVKLRRSPG